jgi:hypothetical protein
MKYFIRISIILVIIAFASGCTAAQKVLFSDDFSNTSGNWDKHTDDNFTTNYHEDAYRILVNAQNYDAWANPDDLKFTDVQVEVDATKNAGPDTNDYGIICRYSGKDSYYYGVIASDGYYGIYKKTAEGGRELGSGGEQFSDKIPTGAVTNHIRFDCNGSTLSLYVNGVLIDQQTDSSYTQGNVGLIAGTYSQTGADILFDNFIVYEPGVEPTPTGN